MHRTSRNLQLAVLLVAGMLLATAAFAQEALLGGDGGSKISSVERDAQIAKLETLLASNPNNYRDWFQLGSLYQDAGKDTKAVEAYEQAIQLNPKYTEALVNLGGVYNDTGDYDKAKAYLEEALALNPEDCRARSNLGNVYYSMGRYPDAMFEYERAVETDPKCYSSLYNIGVAFADAGLFREAVNYWKKVVAIAPGTEAARSARENIEILRRFTEAPIPPANHENE